MSRRSRRSTRIKACQLAALVLSGRPNDELVPRAWSLTVFFENYIDQGAAGTRKDFGPKKAVKLKVVT
jgi:hypothetical protein